jgi:hypothetical protein
MAMVFFRGARMLPACLVLFVFSPAVYAYAEVGDAFTGHTPSILSVSYAVSQDVANLSFAQKTVALQTETPRVGHVAVPEPYSYVLATFGVLGVLAMGTFFRKRKKTKQPTGSRSRHSAKSSFNGQATYR